MKARVLVVDHADSFVFVLGEQFSKRGAVLKTYRSRMDLPVFEELVASFDPHLVVLSPGPGQPASAGVTVPWLHTRPNRPVLGICLGHQALAEAFGGKIGKAPRPVHGKPGTVRLTDDPAFRGLPQTMRVARYHSLVATEVPTDFVVTARTDDKEALVMAMRHRTLPYIGLQFHPESILTPQGGLLIENILAEALSERDGSQRGRKR